MMYLLFPLWLACSSTDTKPQVEDVDSNNTATEQDTTDTDSTTSTDASECTDDAQFYSEEIAPIVNTKCIGCHTIDGVAAGTQFILTEGDEAANLTMMTELATKHEDDGFLLYLKPTGTHSSGHVGGDLLPVDGADAKALALFIGRSNDLVDDCATEFDIGGAELVVDCDAQQAGRRLLRRLSHVEYDNTISDLFAIDAEWGSAFAADNVIHGYNNGADGLQVSALLVDQYMNAAEEVAGQVVHSQLESVLPCDFVDRNVNCAEDFLVGFGTKIFRRPLNNSEMSQYLSLFEEVYYEDGFNEAMEWTIAALLQSPQFLYRSELGEADGQGNFKLTSWEIATELSYLIWQTTPDAQLLALAESDALQDPTVVLQQAQQMLADPRASQTVISMSEQWFSLDLLPFVSREGDYEALTDEVRGLMTQEVNKLLYHAFADNISFTDLLTVQHSYMNQTLADYYGVSLGNEQPDSDGFVKVDLAADPRYGSLLGQGAILTVHALPVTSSPVHRGVLVRERLLCQELPPPPANLDTSPPVMDPSLSTRQRYEVHVADPACSGCHNLIDPLGFGFEHYDGIGRWRDYDGEHEVDATGTVLLNDVEQPYDGVQELSVLLAQDNEVSQCYVQQWFTYGFGDGDMEEPAVQCGVDAATEIFMSDGARLQSPVIAMTQIERFFQRSGDVSEMSTLAVPSDYIEVNPEDTADPGGGTGDLEFYVHEDSNWGAGYCNSVTVTNVSAANVVWEITIEVPGTINSLWNAQGTATGNGDDMTFVGVEWNAELTPGNSADFGFCANL